MKENRKKSELIYQGKAVDFYSDIVLLPDGNTAVREYIKHPGAVAVIPFLNKEFIILVKQYRYPVKKFMLELPAGKMNEKESPLSCIKRELEEETGFKAKKWKRIFSYYPSCAFSTETLYIYQAENLIPTGKRPDKDEFLERVIIRFNDALDMVYKGKINDSKTVIGLLLAGKSLKSL